ncbi:hypothetical protein H8356DRAFT_1629880 [Neocallimastix lanati (nom. inval.)]|jgi:cation channel sperm-associated protein 3|uniref:Ion transport domain-containing protein n=1 Tax=Neocallimastix californiae TaxID=1754190 RepID=A0A1Y2ES95_9FUNG|nr:hypothetical protein H8356DRAFT_1629880 [Neocallimastix sp. JGI-2020a]ORY74448.1 hypothetical protein LY90DRAFT_666251 [Neocallimastix californiae]|eukprot:ORY74448.1 hypothetical protein LY90DRAFT_666251 [Neocallimastix californiae]
MTKDEYEEIKSEIRSEVYGEVYDDKSKKKQWSIKQARIKAIELIKEIESKGINKNDDKMFITKDIAKRMKLEEKEEERKTYSPLRKFAKMVGHSSYFNNFIMFIILANVVTIALETEELAKKEIGASSSPFYHYIDNIYLSIYTFEFFLKWFADRSDYWNNGYNIFDFVVLFISYVTWVIGMMGSLSTKFSFLRVLRALRALRSFRSISFIHNLQVIVTALTQTLKNDIIDVILMLLLIMFVFAVSGVYFFGQDITNTDAYNSWHSIGNSFYVIWVLVTSDGWTAYSYELEQYGYRMHQFFFVIFIFIGNMIFTNIFIAIICQNIDNATDKDKAIQKHKLMLARKEKQDYFLKKQKEDMEKLISKKKFLKGGDMQELLQKAAGKLRHEDMIPMSYLACSLLWMETYLVTLNYHENTMYRSQQAHFHIANTLCELVDRQINDY